MFISTVIKYYRSNLERGAKTNAPIPEPQTAIPLAKARRFSNHWPTITMAGRYTSPKVIPFNEIEFASFNSIHLIHVHQNLCLSLSFTVIIFSDVGYVWPNNKPTGQRWVLTVSLRGTKLALIVCAWWADILMKRQTSKNTCIDRLIQYTISQWPRQLINSIFKEA